MAKIKPTQRIFDVVESINKDEYRLPSIQRSFVWEEGQLYKLMDSIMNDYPIGSFLVWRPPENLQLRTRRFMRDYVKSTRLIADGEPIPRSTYLVLDGQQRLQCLYLSFFGQYDGKSLHFKLDSDPHRPPEDVRYQFKFMSSEEASRDSHWVRPIAIVNLKIEGISKFVDTQFKVDSENTRDMMKKNLGKLIRTFNMDEKLAFQEVEEDLGYNDVLEVFVRANSGGTVLTKSDLVFSTMVLRVPEMEENFIELVDQMNAGGHFAFDTDFLIKASFVLFDKGAKYDVTKLRDQQYVDLLESAFGQFKASLTSTMEFLMNDAKVLTQRFLKSNLALIPVIDFIYRQPHQQVPEGQAISMRQYLYMSFFTRVFSHGADGKLDFMHDMVKKSQPGHQFPAGPLGKYISDRTGAPYELGKGMLDDLDLVLNIVQGGVSQIPQLRGWSLERDHIFPRSLLVRRGIVDGIDNVGNLRLLNKTRNILKSDSLPDEHLEFFGSKDDDIAPLFGKARQDLTIQNFNAFVQEREYLMFNIVKSFLGF